jgi:Fungal chitosanase of glycosyl hydrolase group 75
MLPLATALIGGALLVQAQPYTPPAASAALLKGIPFASAQPAGDRFKSRFSECDTKDTCDGKAQKRGCSKDRNSNTALLKLPGGAIFFDGKMGVDADGSPLSRNNPGSTDQPETSFRYPAPGRPSVDSDKVPFIVIPGGGFGRAMGIQMGDIAAVVFKDRVVFALVADQGPTCKLGEGSIELHERLGHKVCIARNDAKECTKLRDVSITRDALFFVFPGSKAAIIDGLTAANVNERLSGEGPKLFEKLRTAQ